MQRNTLDGTTLAAIYAPVDDARAVMVLAHGAGAGHDHHHMEALSSALNAVGVSTLRFNFPFTEEGRRRVDSLDVCLETIGQAITTAQRLCPGARLLIGGHSFGGRMSTHYAAAHPGIASGIILFSFPLHPGKKPDTKRAAHLGNIREPMLFLSGERDTLAETALLKSVIKPLRKAQLHLIETADHSFKILKRTRISKEDVYAEAGRVTSTWITATFS